MHHRCGPVTVTASGGDCENGSLSYA
jgi:hypothetical protein